MYVCAQGQYSWCIDIFISIYFKTSSCNSDPEINTFIYGPPPSINSAHVSCPRWTASYWTHVCWVPQILSSGFPLFLSVAVRWEVTSHFNPRSPASHHPPASPGSLLSCPASPCPPPAFTTLLESWRAVPQLWLMTNKAPCQQQSEREACKTKANGRSLVMSLSSFHGVHSILEFLPCLLMAMHNLTPVKYGRCVVARICPGIPSTTLWNYVPASIIKPSEIIACTWQVRFGHLAWSSPSQKCMRLRKSQEVLFCIKTCMSWQYCSNRPLPSLDLLANFQYHCLSLQSQKWRCSGQNIRLQSSKCAATKPPALAPGTQ